VENPFKKYLNKKVVVIWKENPEVSKSVVGLITNLTDEFIFLRDDYGRDIIIRIDCVVSIKTWGREK
jgi:small nuclear ribonucleoprotein (snRNP)-like protein